MSAWYRAAVTACLLGLLALPSASAAVEELEAASMEAFLGRVELASVWNPDERGPHSPASVEREIASIVEELGEGRPTYRRARRLHRLLHRRYLDRYDARADDLVQLVDTGRFNCLSATLFYGLVARELGFAPRVVETPGHVYLRLTINQRREIDVETTDRDGFDVIPQPGLTYLHPTDGGLAGWAWQPGGAVAHGGHPRVYALEGALPFLWLNSAGRAVEAGLDLHAAEAAREAFRLLPEDDRHEDSIQHVLGRAFMRNYQAGLFDAALRVARIDVEMFPDRTVTRDRLLAAASRLIEADCLSDDPLGARAVLDEVVALVPDEDRVRLERRAHPRIAVAAVRLGAWSLARESAESYAAVEPDPVESWRLMRWVEQRKSGHEDGIDLGIPPYLPLLGRGH